MNKIQDYSSLTLAVRAIRSDLNGTRAESDIETCSAIGVASVQDLSKTLHSKSSQCAL